MKMADRKTSHVVMLTNTYDADAGSVVPVSAEEAKTLIANNLARAPRPGEVKAAAESK